MKKTSYVKIEKIQNNLMKVNNIDNINNNEENATENTVDGIRAIRTEIFEITDEVEIAKLLNNLYNKKIQIMQSIDELNSELNLTEIQINDIEKILDDFEFTNKKAIKIYNYAKGKNEIGNI